MERDALVGHDRDVNPNSAILEAEIDVGVLLDDRTRREAHQADHPQRALYAARAGSAHVSPAIRIRINLISVV